MNQKLIRFARASLKRASSHYYCQSPALCLLLGLGKHWLSFDFQLEHVWPEGRGGEIALRVAESGSADPDGPRLEIIYFDENFKIWSKMLLVQLYINCAID
jgi:hypothetical protein